MALPHHFLGDGQHPRACSHLASGYSDPPNHVLLVSIEPDRASCESGGPRLPLALTIVLDLIAPTLYVLSDLLGVFQFFCLLFRSRLKSRFRWKQTE